MCWVKGTCLLSYIYPDVGLFLWTPWMDSGIPELSLLQPLGHGRQLEPEKNPHEMKLNFWSGNILMELVDRAVM